MSKRIYREQDESQLINSEGAVINMELLRVLVTSKIGERNFKKIVKLSSQIDVQDISDLFTLDSKVGDPNFAAGIIKLTNEEVNKKLDAMLANVEIIFGQRLPEKLVTRAPKLKWIQVPLTGVNMFLTPEIKESNIVLTNGRGFAAVPISEFIIGLMLQFVKQTPAFYRAKQERQWNQVHPVLLRSKTVGIIGLGKIGQEVARLSKAFHMRVIALDVQKVARGRFVDKLYAREQLHSFLSKCDFVVLTLPLTPESYKMIGEKEMSAMKPTTYLINTSRGNITDEQALIKSIEEHRIGGAGLDVYSTEPLPPEHKLWVLPNVIMSPHMSGQGVDLNKMATDLFCNNLKRFLSGKKLTNVVDKNKGYVI